MTAKTRAAPTRDPAKEHEAAAKERGEEQGEQPAAADPEPDETERELTAQEEELQGLLQIRRRILMDEARPENWLWHKLANLIYNLPAVTKDGRFVDKNDKLRYRFVSQAQVMSLVGKRMAALGLLRIPEIVEHHVHREDDSDGLHVTIKMREHLICVDSGRRETFEWSGEAADWGDKATQKAGTSADKYFLMKLFDLTDFRDPDAENPVDENEGKRRPRSTSAEPARSTTPDNAQRQEQLAKLLEFGNQVGIVNGERKRGAPQWFAQKLNARIKYHSKTTATFETMSDQEWRAGVAAVFHELRAEHVEWCGEGCQHIPAMARSDEPATDRKPDLEEQPGQPEETKS